MRCCCRRCCCLPLTMCLLPLRRSSRRRIIVDFLLLEPNNNGSTTRAQSATGKKKSGGLSAAGAPRRQQIDAVDRKRQSILSAAVESYSERVGPTPGCCKAYHPSCALQANCYNTGAWLVAAASIRSLSVTDFDRPMTLSMPPIRFRRKGLIRGFSICGTHIRNNRRQAEGPAQHISRKHLKAMKRTLS